MSVNVIGVAGCGAMGLPMAQQLYAAGFDTWGFDLRPANMFGSFSSRMISNAQDFAATVDTVITVVRDLPQTMDLCFDKQAIFSGDQYPRILICSSTLSPKVLPDILTRLPDNVSMIDAPMSGAPARAKEGSLTFMVGGDDTAVRTALPLFKAMGNHINHLGPMGLGMTCKVINNFVAVTNVATIRKAIEASKALDMDPRTLLGIMRTSSGGTWYGNNIDNISWGYEGYDPDNTIGILEKDMLAFLDAVSGNPDIALENLVSSVLDVIRNADALEF